MGSSPSSNQERDSQANGEDSSEENDTLDTRDITEIEDNKQDIAKGHQGYKRKVPQEYQTSSRAREDQKEDNRRVRFADDTVESGEIMTHRECKPPKKTKTTTFRLNAKNSRSQETSTSESNCDMHRTTSEASTKKQSKPKSRAEVTSPKNDLGLPDHNKDEDISEDSQGRIFPMPKPEGPIPKPEKPVPRPERPMPKREKPMQKPERPMTKPERPMPKRIKANNNRQKEPPKDAPCLNLDFYLNKIRSRPKPGHFIDEMLTWKGNYRKLEVNHQYIQWLFPIPEPSGVNLAAQPLLEHEIEAIRTSKECQSRFLKAFEMMLHFYGIELENEKTGEIRICSKNWKKRFAHLNKSGHNYLRITRIIRALGCFGFEHLQKPLVMFFLHEIFEKRTLSGIRYGAVERWIDTIFNHVDRDLCLQYFDGLRASCFKSLDKQVPEQDESDSESDSDDEQDDIDSEPANTKFQMAKLLIKVKGEKLTEDESIREEEESENASIDKAQASTNVEGPTQNLKFYRNQIKSKPDPGWKILDILKWENDYDKIKDNHYVTQWLFPIFDSTGRNPEAQLLEFQEIEIIRNDKTLSDRFVLAYKMMLGYYGMRLASWKTGEVGHARGWKQRFDFLSRSKDDHSRITRIILALECFGFWYFQYPLVSFLLNETFLHERLSLPRKSLQIWIDVMADTSDKEACSVIFRELHDFTTVDADWDDDKDGDSDAVSDIHPIVRISDNVRAQHPNIVF